MSIESGRRMRAACGERYYESDGGPDCEVCHSAECEDSPDYERNKETVVIPVSERYDERHESLKIKEGRPVFAWVLIGVLLAAVCIVGGIAINCCH